MTEAPPRYTLTLSCPDRVGIAAAINAFLAEHHSAILGATYYVDESRRCFFARQEIMPSSPSFAIDTFRKRFAPIAKDFQMEWTASEQQQKKRMVILVSKLGHCLYDLFERWQIGELHAEIACVISNHETQRRFVERHEVPFHHVPITNNKRDAYDRIQRLFEDAYGDVMVLARYMQILPATLCEAYDGRIINIHHSFLPSFAGAKPYHQAHRRGVKLVGVTCHYVTPDLDQGPIIDQDVVRVSHTDRPDDIVRLGREVEKTYSHAACATTWRIVC
ncbi:formyltetrahydrofolate deformylase [Paraburkholderia aspalathi]